MTDGTAFIDPHPSKFHLDRRERANPSYKSRHPACCESSKLDYASYLDGYKYAVFYPSCVFKSPKVQFHARCIFSHKFRHEILITLKFLTDDHSKL